MQPFEELERERQSLTLTAIGAKPLPEDTHSCWSCGSMRAAHFCESCGKVQPRSRSTTSRSSACRPN